MAREFPINKTRNIGIIAHIDAGKTTVTERILFYTGKTYKLGEVHEGTAVMDWMAQERERGITITAAATTAFWPNFQAAKQRELAQLQDGDQQPFRINIIDTPGHIDFTVEVQRSLRVLDGAVVVFDGVAGVQPQSETVWHQADKFQVPRLCFINKLDRVGADFYQALESIWQRLTPKAVALQIPIGAESNFRGIIDLLTLKAEIYTDDLGQMIEETTIPAEFSEPAKKWRTRLVEKIVETDEPLLHRYLEGHEPSVNELKLALRQATTKSKLIPVVGGTALKNKGIQFLLDAIVDYLPGPSDRPPTPAKDTLADQPIDLVAEDKGLFAALAFKIAADPYVGTLTYIRVYSGTLKSGTTVLNSNKNEKERIGRMVRMHANHREEVSELLTGDIAAVVGLKYTSTGDTLTSIDQPLILETIAFPEPVISMAIEPKTEADQEKLGMTLNRLQAEDPTFKVIGDPDTNQTLIAGMGELHLEIIVDRMKREFNVEAKTGQPQVAYKETIQKPVKAEGKYIRQTGGRGQYGHVLVELEPLQRGAGFEFVDKIKGGIIPREYIPAVEKGVREAMSKGVLAGYPVVDCRLTLYDGSYHEVDSSELAFHIAGSIAFQQAAKQAGPVLLEPIMKVEVIVPEEFFGEVMGDLSSKRARILESSSRGVARVIEVHVPLNEMFGYATHLRSMTQGRGSFTMEFDHYAEVPANLTEKIIEGRARTKR